MTRSPAPRSMMFTGAASNRLRADVFGDVGQPVLLLHGGGQTRHAWRNTAAQLARAGWVAYALDQRGHGDSAWVETGGYTFGDFAADAAIGRRRACRPPRDAAGISRRIARRHRVVDGRRRGAA